MPFSFCLILNAVVQNAYAACESSVWCGLVRFIRLTESNGVLRSIGLRCAHVCTVAVASVSVQLAAERQLFCCSVNFFSFSVRNFLLDKHIFLFYYVNQRESINTQVNLFCFWCLCLLFRTHILDTFFPGELQEHVLINFRVFG